MNGARPSDSFSKLAADIIEKATDGRPATTLDCLKISAAVAFGVAVAFGADIDVEPLRFPATPRTGVRFTPAARTGRRGTMSDMSDPGDQRHLVNCAFYERIPVSTVDGQPVIGTRYRYGRVDTGGFHDSLMDMWMFHPPQVGDLVHLDEGYRVVGRSWMYSRRGSGNWPANEPMPVVGPTLALIVEREDGPFVDEAEPDGSEE